MRLAPVTASNVYVIQPGEDIAPRVTKRSAAPVRGCPRDFALEEARRLGRLHRGESIDDSDDPFTVDDIETRLYRLRAVYGEAIETAAGISL